jgi:hypothetical protein
MVLQSLMTMLAIGVASNLDNAGVAYGVKKFAFLFYPISSLL